MVFGAVCSRNGSQNTHVGPDLYDFVFLRRTRKEKVDKGLEKPTIKM